MSDYVVPCSELPESRLNPNKADYVYISKRLTLLPPHHFNFYFHSPSFHSNPHCTTSLLILLCLPLSPVHASLIRSGISFLFCLLWFLCIWRNISTYKNSLFALNSLIALKWCLNSHTCAGICFSNIHRTPTNALAPYYGSRAITQWVEFLSWMSQNKFWVTPGVAHPPKINPWKQKQKDQHVLCSQQLIFVKSSHALYLQPQVSGFKAVSLHEIIQTRMRMKHV